MEGVLRADKDHARASLLPCSPHLGSWSRVGYAQAQEGVALRQQMDLTLQFFLEAGPDVVCDTPPRASS